MNPFGFPPRTWAYLVSLELSEVITHHVVPYARRGKRAATERFAEAEWRLVERLDRFAGSRSLRGLATLRADLAGLRPAAAALGLTRDLERTIDEKLLAIEAALDAVESIARAPVLLN